MRLLREDLERRPVERARALLARDQRARSTARPAGSRSRAPLQPAPALGVEDPLAGLRRGDAIELAPRLIDRAARASSSAASTSWSGSR